MSATQMVNIEFEELAPGIIVYKNVIKDYDTIINDIKTVELSAPELSWKQAGSYTDGKTEIILTHRNTDQIYIPYVSESLEQVKNADDASPAFLLSMRLHESFDKCENHYKIKFSAVTKKHEGYAILRYGIDQKFNSHVDDHPDFTRRISTVYYLNEDYSGGEISFNNFGISYKPKANEMILFPSNYVYMHAVSPVTSGTRYAIVSWLN